MDREDILSKKLAHVKLRFDPTGRFTVLVVSVMA